MSIISSLKARVTKLEDILGNKEERDDCKDLIARTRISFMKLNEKLDDINRELEGDIRRINEYRINDRADLMQRIKKLEDRLGGEIEAASALLSLGAKPSRTRK